MGVALQACTLPGSSGVAREIAEGTMELGLGIHGEPGAHTAKTTSADEVVETLMTSIFAQNEKIGKLSEGSNVALMVNSLGATPLMELYVAAPRRVLVACGREENKRHARIRRHVHECDRYERF